MEFTIKAGSPEKLKSDCVVVGVYAGSDLTASAKALDKAADGAITALVARGELDDKVGATLMLHDLPGIAAPRVLLVSLGKADELTDKSYRDAVGAAAKQLAGSVAADAAFILTETELPHRDLAWRISQAAQILKDSTYRCDELKSKREESKKGVKKVVFIAKAKDTAPLEAALRRGTAIAEGMALAKTLGNLPGNVCTPTYLATTARKLAKDHKIKVEVLEKGDMEKLGMGALLSVARGSHEPPKFIILNYKGGKAKDKPVVLVGKGITFDSGGLSLKSTEGMFDMKYDMSGAACVLGAIKAIAKLGEEINVIGLIPATENMPGGSSIKPGDIVTSMSGSTIEILNTDAEGRIILADALSYSKLFNPEYVIDVATLTGATVIALGTKRAALFTNSSELQEALTKAANNSNDFCWSMPLDDEYFENLSTNFADMANVGPPEGSFGASAYFLSRFTQDVKWAHLDITGVAWQRGKDKRSTGRPTPLLIQFLIDHCNAKKP
ncbi:leucyl aminopeptidase [uncultured Zoogloea sp.]|uniref:leucyl aminopeptidase n=1 Tax=uncultured Zoogloea sp. TaxID=160237 RepID=UPI002633472F|nr:leucyl aminopeptidase [uncultured Zoogloea sp.]